MEGQRCGWTVGWLDGESVRGDASATCQRPFQPHADRFYAQYLVTLHGCTAHPSRTLHPARTSRPGSSACVAAAGAAGSSAGLSASARLAFYLASERFGHWYRAHSGSAEAAVSDAAIARHFQSVSIERGAVTNHASIAVACCIL